MDFPKEDILFMRNLIAEKGDEMTPNEIIEIMKEVVPDLVIVDEPGLASLIREFKKYKGAEGENEF